MNETQIDPDYFNPPSQILQKSVAIIGIISTIENLFIFIVFVSQRSLHNSSSLLIGLTLTHVLNGITLVIPGFWPSSYAPIMVPPSFCIVRVWPVLVLLAFQIVPFLLGLNGLERLLALGAPVFYRTKCTPDRLWRVSALALSFTILLALADCVGAWWNSLDNHVISAICLCSDIFGTPFLIYTVHIPAIVCGLCSVVCTGISAHLGRRRMFKIITTNSNSEIKRLRKQIRLTVCLLTISVVDVITVVIPNIIFLLYNAGKLNFPPRYLAFASLAFGFDSAWNLIAFLSFNSEFRKAAVKFLRCQKETRVFTMTGGRRGDKSDSKRTPAGEQGMEQG